MPKPAQFAKIFATIFVLSNKKPAYRLVRAFDPSFAGSEPLDTARVKDMAKIKPLSANNLIKVIIQMEKELPAYLAAAQGVTFDHKDINKFTEDVLAWWRKHGKKFPSWALGARIVFAFS